MTRGRREASTHPPARIGRGCRPPRRPCVWPPQPFPPRDPRRRELAPDRERAVARSRSEIERTFRRRRQRVERLLVHREVVGTPNRVPLRGERVEEPLGGSPEDAPYAWARNDGVRRETREL